MLCSVLYLCAADRKSCPFIILYGFLTQLCSACCSCHAAGLFFFKDKPLVQLLTKQSCCRDSIGALYVLLRLIRVHILKCTDHRLSVTLLIHCYLKLFIFAFPFSAPNSIVCAVFFFHFMVFVWGFYSFICFFYIFLNLWLATIDQ